MPPRPDRGRRALRWGVGGVAAVLYANFVLAWSGGPRATWLDVISSLEAPGQPDAVLLRVTDVVCAALVLALLPGARRGLRPGPARTVTVVLVAAFALFSTWAAVVPPPCGPGASCDGAVQSQVHDAVSLLADTALFASVATAWLALDPRATRWARRAAAAVLLGGGLAATVAFAWFDRTGEPWWAAGVAQRVHVIFISLWLVVLAAIGVDPRPCGAAPDEGVGPDEGDDDGWQAPSS